jgi:1-acyl-sn-glycerol-3-phosphate acyltransferase
VTVAPTPAAPAKRPGPVPRSLYRVLRLAMRLVCGLVWRVRVEGVERLPVTGPYVVAPVHRSNVDFLVVGASVPRVMRYMVKDSVWKVAAVGRFVEWMGSFAVNRDRADRRALRCAEEALAQGDPVVMFPEGGRRSGERVAELMGGAAWLACRNRVPVVPIGLSGTDRAMPIGSRMIRPVAVRVVIGEPVYPDVSLGGRVPYRVVKDFSQKLREEVQAVYDESRRP